MDRQEVINTLNKNNIKWYTTNEILDKNTIFINIEKIEYISELEKIKNVINELDKNDNIMIDFYKNYHLYSILVCD